MNTLGSLIRRYRKKKGMTQTDLGKILYVTKQAISKWENDAAIPDLFTLRKLSNILGITNDEIFGQISRDPRFDADILSCMNSAFFNKNPAIEKWRDFKFGMFIHYGLYSVLEQFEWAMFWNGIDKDEYAKIANDFKADKFDAAKLCNLAKNAGMKYIVFTTRHHDGFCLFDSKSSIGDFTIMNTPAKRDIIKEYVDACHKSGIAAGLYYSPMDWRCEGFFLPKMYHKSALAMREQCHAQLKELMSNYGEIDILWYDGGEDFWLAHGMDLRCFTTGRREDWRTEPPIKEFWGEFQINNMVRELQPGIVTNNRLGMCRTGDYGTPERVVGAFNLNDPWETCDTISETWGYTPDGKLMELKDVIHLLINVITGGGNLLLNVSPMGDGSIAPEHEKRLLEVGDWTRKYADCIYSTRGGPIRNSHNVGGFTHKDNKLYCFIEEENRSEFKIPLMDAKIVNITSLSGEGIEKTSVSDGVMTVTLKSCPKNKIASVVEIEFDRSAAEIFEKFDPECFDAFE